eukprot:1458699-Rhodomonas_salina.1
MGLSTEPCISGTVLAYGSRCGSAGWVAANAVCGMPCFGTNFACPAGEQCHGGLSVEPCQNSAPPPPP